MKSQKWLNAICQAFAFLLWGSQLMAFASAPYQPIEDDPVLATWRWRVYEELSGLGLRCMIEDRDRSMWFGIEDGLKHYDGIQWTSYGAKEGISGNVECLALGPDGPYAGGSTGIHRYKGNGQWERIFPPAGQKFGVVRRMTVARDGSLWAATDWGALRFQRDTIVLYTDKEGELSARPLKTTAALQVALFPQTILARPYGKGARNTRSMFFEVYEDRQNRIWLGTDGGEILCYTPFQSKESTVDKNSSEWTLYNEADGIVCDLRPRFLQLDDGMLWVVFQGVRGRAHQFDGKTWKNIRLANLGAPDSSDWLLQTRDGVLWIGCHGAICAYRQGGLRVYEPPRVPIPSVRTFLMQSSDGALWVGGQGGEVMRLDYQTKHWIVYRDLNFHWESPSGTQWFIHRDGQVIRREGNTWTSLGISDGLIDAPVALVGMPTGEVWVSGSHQGVAASARLKDGQWTRFIHEQLSWGVDWRSVFVSSDGSLWLGAAVNYANLGRKYLGGIVQYRQGQWLHHKEGLGSYYGVGESRDGRIWGGWDSLWHYENQVWKHYPDELDHRLGRLEILYTTRDRNLWVGTRQYGLFCYDGRQWTRHHTDNGLVANTIRSFTECADGSLWVATDRGIGRYDGRRWISDIMPVEFNMPREGGSLKSGRSGGLWINRSSRNWNRRAWPQAPLLDLTTQEFWTAFYRPDTSPPKTTITLGEKNVSPSGNVVLAWKGTDAWNITSEKNMMYSIRLDGGPWSDFFNQQNHMFQALKSGFHLFEVRARDLDFNVEPMPAKLEFKVLPPVWREPWFISLISALILLIIAQTVRVMQRGRRLHKANDALAVEVAEHRRVGIELQQKKAFLEEANQHLELAMQEREKTSRELEVKVDELQEAMKHIKTLRGIVPICAGCKKIRDDKGYWQQVESYVTQHSHAQFSHGLCPECIPKYYPDYLDKNE